MQSHSNPILELDNIDAYRGQQKVLEKFSLALHLHEHTAILGANGAGKTTLLKLLTREIYPVVNDKSHIRIMGEEKVNLWDLRKKIGVVSQDFHNHYQTLATGKDVVLSAFFGSVGIYQHHEITAEQHICANEQLEKFNLLHLAEKPFLSLSTGQQRRLLLARALMHNPQVLIFDEPTSGLDVGASFQLLHTMREFTKNGGTLILVTHHINEIVPEVSRVVILEKGKITHDGQKQDILQSDILSKTFDTSLVVNENCGFFHWQPNDKNHY